MSYGRRESPWRVMRRCLAIIQRLMRGPATGPELIRFVRAQVGKDAYSHDHKAALRAFKRDRKHLHHDFGVRWEYDASAGLYVLDSPGAFALLDLSDDHLVALGVMYSTFEEHEPAQVPVKPLLDHLLSLLPAERRRSLAHMAQIMRLEMVELDERRIPLNVWDTVERATRRHRQLAFNYYSPQQSDGKPRYWVVAPVEIRFRRGHWYLFCWQIYWRSHLGERHDASYRRFRLQYIADDDRLEVLPTRIAVEHRRPPRVSVYYLLKPPVGRGDISRHFQEMTVERQPDGSVLVKGFCDDAWDAVRTLLGYGENCIVLGGDEVLRLARRRARGMAENYGYCDRSEGEDLP